VAGKDERSDSMLWNDLVGVPDNENEDEEETNYEERRYSIVDSEAAFLNASVKFQNNKV